MARVMTFEGLNALLGVVPRSGGTGATAYPAGDQFVLPATQYLLLFTSQTASTVPNQDNKLSGGASTPFTSSATGGAALMVEETSAGGYARANIPTPGTTWPADVRAYGSTVGSVATGRVTTMTGTGISFAQSSAAYAATINGFGICNAATTAAQNDSFAWGYANFNDTTAITVNAAGFTIRIQAAWEADG